MHHDEYPHPAVFQKLTKKSDGGGGFTSLWTDVLEFNGFLDTPTSRERFEAQQLTNPMDRNFFFPYRTDVTANMRCICEGDTYELVGRPQDQGGQREIMMVPLKLVEHA